MITSVTIQRRWEYDNPNSQIAKKIPTNVLINIESDVNSDMYRIHRVEAPLEQIIELAEMLNWFLEDTTNDPERMIAKSLKQPNQTLTDQ